MSFIKGKKIVVMTLIFVMCIVLAHQPLTAAKERRGSTVEVTMTDGRTVKGELLAVKPDALLIYNQDAGQGKNLDLRQVVQVKVIKKSKILAGLGIGLGLGLGILIGTGCKELNCESYLEMRKILLLPVFSLIGVMIGAEASFRRFDIAEAPSLAVPKKLERLKRYAREQDVPSGPGREEN